MNNKKDIYDVDNYTDSELFDLLDLVNPTDRVLEAKIIQMIQKYSSIQNESGRKLSNFFIEIYNRFFYEEKEEGMENMEDDYDENDMIEDYVQQENFENAGINNSIQIYSGPQNEQTLQSNVLSTSLKVYDKTNDTNSQMLGITGNNIVGDNTDYSKPAASTVKVNQLDYTKDKINPLLKQTVKRIISIDSQYRDNKYSLSTEFTFNLSEPLKDVVALRLYSVQIPYTWYTISNNYGGNFFYLKGNSTGITSGDFDYKIDILSGNYSPDSLANTINSSITNLKNTYSDISFGSTGINYNSYTGLSTLTIDLKNLYNETDYELIFPDSSLNIYPDVVDSNGDQLRYSSTASSTLSAYFGYNYKTYTPNVITSYRTLPLTTIGSSDDLNNAHYYLDDTNNYFTIYQYTGPGEYDASNVVFSTSIKLDISGNQTRNTIVENLNTKLSENKYLKNSYVVRNDITDISMSDYNQSYFSLYINLEKKTIPTANILGLKTAIVFPTETNTTNRIWVKESLTTSIYCCFQFKSTICELNNIMAEENSLQTNYVINSSPYILLKCTTSGYTSDYAYNGNVISSSVAPYRKIWNDYIIDISNSTVVGGYSLSDYLNEINSSFNRLNTLSIDSSNPTGIFNMSTSGVYDNSTTDNKVMFRFDISKYFKNDSYLIDLSGSFLFNVLGLGSDISGINGVYGSMIDLSVNNVFTFTTNAQSSYQYFDNDCIAVIYPKPNYSTNVNAGAWYIYPSLSSYTSTNSKSFASITTGIFQSYQDVSSSYPFLLGSTNLSIVTNSDGTMTSTLTININKTLSQNDYQAVFYDPSGVNENSSWYNNLKIADLSYNLSDYLVSGKTYSDIYGYSILPGYKFTINKDTYFTIRPVTLGVFDANYANDITIRIPAATSSTDYQYTRQELYNIINTEFSNNSLTSGSTISSKVINSKEYICIRLNINKLYTPNDYRIVFYDPYSFVKCYSGIKSVKNVTWDSTLGWILGYRLMTEYYLSDYINNSNIATIIGDTTVTTNLYNYFLIVLDDYTQSHLNDGLVTLTPQENDVALPSYAKRSITQCDSSGNPTYVGALTNMQNNLTQNQIYSINQILEGRKNKLKTYSNGPFIQDIFGLIPMKVSGLSNGSTYIEFGGTLQNQERTYFGPVNIHRMTIKLLNDRGDTVDLNGSNWSFSFICEQLYQQKSI